MRRHHSPKNDLDSKEMRRIQSAVYRQLLRFHVASNHGPVLRLVFHRRAPPVLLRHHSNRHRLMISCDRTSSGSSVCWSTEVRSSFVHSLTVFGATRLSSFGSRGLPSIRGIVIVLIRII